MRRYIIYVFGFLMTANLTVAQAPSFLSSISQDSAIDIALTLDWKTLGRKKKDKAYLPAVISMRYPGADSLSLPMKVRTRGHMRLEICSQPPLKLKFAKEELARLYLSDHNEVDLVHPCHSGELYEQMILKEYLAYKLYQVISPVSFNVQLIRLKHLDAEGSESMEDTYAFLVEHTEELVERIGGREHNVPVISQHAVDRKALLRVCLFQYMIGNTDWYVKNRHNLEFIVVPGHSLLVPVPFDFDYSGLVNAPYAAHHESIDLPSVTIRYYQGRCESDEEVNMAIREFMEKKEELLRTCDQIQGLNARTAQQAKAYLQDFFEIIEHPKKVENSIIRHCDLWPVSN